MHNLKDIIVNYSHLSSNVTRLQLLLQASLTGIKNPEDAQSISKVGDLSNFHVLRWLRNEMKADPTGVRILDTKPRINEETLPLNRLRNFESNTLGKAYFDFMTKYEFSSNERPLVEYIPDLELAYILQRYRETHDFYHILLGLSSIEIIDELAVKLFEALNLRLPSSSMMALSSFYLLDWQAKTFFIEKYAKQLVAQREGNKLVLNYYFEENLHKPIDLVRAELGIKAIKL